MSYGLVQIQRNCPRDLTTPPPSCPFRLLKLAGQPTLLLNMFTILGKTCFAEEVPCQCAIVILSMYKQHCCYRLTILGKTCFSKKTTYLLLCNDHLDHTTTLDLRSCVRTNCSQVTKPSHLGLHETVQT